MAFWKRSWFEIDFNQSESRAQFLYLSNQPIESSAKLKYPSISTSEIIKKTKSGFQSDDNTLALNESDCVYTDVD